MQIVKANKVNKISASSSTTILEYLMDEKDISGSIGEISGRYPENGFAINKVSKELAFILSGTGTIITEKDKQTFAANDTIFIDRGEKFYWQGNFTMFMVTTPKFSSKQHKIV